MSTSTTLTSRLQSVRHHGDTQIVQGIGEHVDGEGSGAVTDGLVGRGPLHRVQEHAAIPVGDGKGGVGVAHVARG